MYFNTIYVVNRYNIMMVSFFFRLLHSLELRPFKFVEPLSKKGSGYAHDTTIGPCRKCDYVERSFF